MQEDLYTLAIRLKISGLRRLAFLNLRHPKEVCSLLKVLTNLAWSNPAYFMTSLQRRKDPSYTKPEKLNFSSIVSKSSAPNSKA